MKQYIRASSGYTDIFRKITRYFESIVKRAGCTYCTWNDYTVEPDWAGGGIRTTLQWDGGTISEDEVARMIESYFHQGVRCTDAWGNWDHQLLVHVEEWRCR